MDPERSRRAPDAATSRADIALAVDEIAGCPDPVTTIRHALIALASLLGAEVAAAVTARDGVVDSLGPVRDDDAAALLEASATAAQTARLDELGPMHLASVAVAQPEVRHLVVGRRLGAFDDEERIVLGAVAGLVTVVLENLRQGRVLRDRHRLLERTSRIQRSISTRVPLADVLDDLGRSTAEMLDSDVVSLWLVDPDDSDSVVLAHVWGATSEGLEPLAEDARSARVAMAEGLPVVTQPRRAGTAAAAVLSAPVSEHGYPIGALVAASRRTTRRYTPLDQEVLMTFAEHAGLALTEAKTLDLIHEAYHDPLTGLPNRALFLERVEAAVASASHDASSVGLLFIDLDGFKQVNDEHGHETGDMVLTEVARRLRAALRDGDTPARLGGDEFAVLVVDAHRAGGAEELAARLLEVLDDAIDIGGQDVVVSASIGVVSGRDGNDVSDLLRNADVAMYRAKLQGKNRYVVFEPSMRRRERRRAAERSAPPQPSRLHRGPADPGRTNPFAPDDAGSLTSTSRRTE